MAHLYLDPVEISDAAALTAANVRSRAYHHPWAFPCTDLPAFEAWLAQMQSDTSIALLARIDAQTIIGTVTISQIVRGSFCSAYLGFYGMVEFAGRGLMTAALRLALDHAFTAEGLHRLEANVQPENTRSLALVRRVGFQREGYSRAYLRINNVWCDHERWAILAPE
jgi:ribosomal-protein-alanine N-acetyltransferase